MSIEHSGFKSAAKDEGIDPMKGTETLRAWRDIWSAGQGVGDIERAGPAGAIVGQMIQDYL